MRVCTLRLEGLKLIQPPLHRDERGFFSETYQKPRYAQAGIEASFVQDNLSFSKKGCLRGLHFQKKPGQAKLVSVLLGEVWDVALDLRPHSPTFGQWEAVILEDKERWQFYIPVGFSHGYCVLSEVAYVQYKVSSVYNAQEEGSIRWNDPDIQIQWPIQDPIVSYRDQRSPFFKEFFWDE